MSDQPYPVVVELQREARRLRVEWEDGHQSLYSLRYLRGFCPCAACQGHSQNTWTFVPTTDPQINEITESGAYALGLAFSDGHATGIYSFDILRELCPCQPCQEALGAAHALRKLPAGEEV